MSENTCSESEKQVMKVLDFCRPDKIPRFDMFWPEFETKCREKLKIDENTSLLDYFGIDLAIAIADETPFPSKRRVISESGRTIILQNGWGRTLEEHRGASFFKELQVILEKKSELDSLEFEPPNLSSRYTSSYQDTSFLQTVREQKARRAVFCKVGGPYLRCAFLRGQTQFLMDIAEDPSFVKALTERMADHLIGVGLESLKRGRLWDTGIWIFDDLGNNLQPMMSPKAFEDIFLPRYKKMIAAFKKAGAKKVCFHSDGNIRPLLDMLIAVGIDAINPLEPKAGLDLPALKKEYGNRVAFIGGMCNSYVLPGKKEDIRSQVESILGVAREGGVIIGAHSIGPDVPIENYQFYVKLIEGKGRF